jgi:hypothetical protein
MQIVQAMSTDRLKVREDGFLLVKFISVAHMALEKLTL